MSTAAAPQRFFQGVFMPAELWLDFRLSPNARFLVAEIKSLSKNGKDCWASDSYLGSMLGVCERQIRRLLAEAENASWIKRETVEDESTPGGHLRIIRSLWGHSGPVPPADEGVDRSVRTEMSDGESEYLVSQRQKQSSTAVPEAAAATPPRARTHEDPAAEMTPTELRLAALRSAPAADPSPTPTDPCETASDPPAAGLLAAFDTEPWEANDSGSKGGECSSEPVEPLCPLEEILEDLMQIELTEDLDDFPDDPHVPPLLPTPDPPPPGGVTPRDPQGVTPSPEFTPRDDTEGARLLVARGVAHDIAEGIAKEQNLARIRDACELAPLKAWSAATLVKCFSAGWDREPANRRRLAASRPAPEEPPPNRQTPQRSDRADFEPVDDAYLRHLRGEETPEEREKAAAQQAYIREQKAALFPERSRPDGSRKPVLPPSVPAPVGDSDPRPIAEIMAEHRQGKRS